MRQAARLPPGSSGRHTALRLVRSAPFVIRWLERWMAPFRRGCAASREGTLHMLCICTAGWLLFVECPRAATSLLLAACQEDCLWSRNSVCARGWRAVHRALPPGFGAGGVLADGVVAAAASPPLLTRAFWPPLFSPFHVQARTHCHRAGCVLLRCCRTTRLALRLLHGVG